MCLLYKFYLCYILLQFSSYFCDVWLSGILGIALKLSAKKNSGEIFVFPGSLIVWRLLRGQLERLLKFRWTGEFSPLTFLTYSLKKCNVNRGILKVENVNREIHVVNNGNRGKTSPAHISKIKIWYISLTILDFKKYGKTSWRNQRRSHSPIGMMYCSVHSDFVICVFHWSYSFMNRALFKTFLRVH